MLDCNCIKLADHISLAKLTNRTILNYSDSYSIHTLSRGPGRSQRSDSASYRSMLQELYKANNNWLAKGMGLFKGHHSGCSFRKYPAGKKSVNASMAVTCLIKRSPGKCRR
ncbi:hypothetical protein Q1695_015907 [Nippostrongylus brasiliensis]|nr:hypothetical protein Q1695_015907 [Nippostrongylus brasiliensis]